MEIRELLRTARGHNPYADAYIDAFDENRQVGVAMGESQSRADTTQILYILNNLQSWRGDEARTVKAELKKIAGVK